MKSYTFLGCTNDGAAYCDRCCPDPDVCEDEHGAIFADSEWDCSPPTCDACGEPIDGVQVIHTPTALGGYCRYCEAEL